jgi:hypothetical protein
MEANRIVPGSKPGTYDRRFTRGGKKSAAQAAKMRKEYFEE